MSQTTTVRTRFLWILLGITLFGISAKFLWDTLPKPSDKPLVQGLRLFGEIPDFSLTAASGRTVTLSDLRGKVWIADFIFTHCGGPCPLMSGKMSGLAKQFSNEPSVRFVSFSVDPDRDTPEVLSQYGKRYEADAKQWLFLTGDKAEIVKLSEQHFHLGVMEIPPEERETVNQTVSHSTKFVLVDPQGKIRGYYDSEAAGEIEKLIRDTRTLIEAS
jgi:cytochrome oxidase Cu insertion factor (SCO1/SenC/PrrC family)